MPRTRAARTLLAAALALAALTGCTAANASPVPSTPAASASTSPHPLASPTTPEPTPSASGATAVSIDCKSVLPKAVLADLGKGFVRQKGFVPAADDDAAKIEALGGSVCGWQSPDSGDTLEIAVGIPSTKDATVLKDDLVERSNSVPTYGEEGYFQVVEGFGVVDAFPGAYWIYAKSDAFFEPGDASGVVSAVAKALNKG